MENTLTEQDLNDLQYFWQVKEDLERLSTFERLMPILEKEKPEVLKAWNDYKASKKRLDIVIHSLGCSITFYQKEDCYNETFNTKER